MDKLKITFFLMISFSSFANKEIKSLQIRNRVIEIISNHFEISIENRKKLIAQSALETGHFKYIKHNNIFNMKEKRNHIYGYAKYKTLEQSINKRINLFIHKNHKFTKDYATNPDYSKLLVSVLKYVKKNYNLTAINNADRIQFRRLLYNGNVLQSNSIIVPYRYRFT